MKNENTPTGGQNSDQQGSESASRDAACSPSSFLRLEIVDSNTGEIITWISIKSAKVSHEEILLMKAFRQILRDLQTKQAENHPNNQVYFLRVVLPDGRQIPTQEYELQTRKLGGLPR